MSNFQRRSNGLLLIIQIPCLNEAETLPATIADLPTAIDGVIAIEYLVIDDGSTDQTASVARELGVHHILSNRRTIGLARSFRKGLDHCLSLGADIIVNTDGDNQYDGRDIEKLITPILNEECDIVVGDRNTQASLEFSKLKKLLQSFGSFIVRRLSGLDVPDAVSGFRAFTREAALQINIVSSFSYTTEMLIQAGNKNLAVHSVPIRTNAVTRESRLFRSIPHFLQQQVTTIIRMFTMYRPLLVFFTFGGILMLVGLLPITRFLYYYSIGEGAGHIQSLVLGGALVSMGLVSLLIGMVSDLINFNRKLIETALEKIRKLELEVGKERERNAQ